MQQMDLLEFQKRISLAVDAAFDSPLWVRAEISQLSVRMGHCYLELVEKDKVGRQLLAKAQAIIWADTFCLLKPFFETTTGVVLQSGIQVLLALSPRMHPLYGMSLIVSDIDPSFTLGDLEQQRRQTLLQLEQEGIIDMNLQLPFPRIPLRLAVVSSENAAGYQDFVNHLWASGFAFFVRLFPAIMQGTEASASMREALEKIAEEADDFDLVLLLRGGGAVADLNCYDDYLLAAHVAQFPLPVLTGIGHHRDVHIVDRVAWKALKTPTAAADFLVDILGMEDSFLERIQAQLGRLATLRIQKERQQIQQRVDALRYAVRRLVEHNSHKLDLAEQRLEQGNPLRLLEKGYVLALNEDRPVQGVASLKEQDHLTLLFKDGRAEVTIQTIEIIN